jgi:hypothetical protein
MSEMNEFVLRIDQRIEYLECDGHGNSARDVAAFRDAAVAEIDRLRAEVAQRTADLERMTAQRNAALDARDITQRTLDGIDGVLAQRTADLAKANAERDEARREVCELLARSMKGPMEIAADRGWDCFDANLCGADGGIGTRR